MKAGPMHKAVANRKPSGWLITGASGFIGSHLVRHILRNKADVQIIMLCRSSAPHNEARLAFALSGSQSQKDRVEVVYGDAAVEEDVALIFERFNITHVFHLSAITHVDNSIKDPAAVNENNMLSCLNLIKQCRKYSERSWPLKLIHLSTDEAWLYSTGAIDRLTNPYAGAKHSADELFLTWSDIYKFEFASLYCPNVYGTFQHTEKFLPKMVYAAAQGDAMTVFGDGNQTRSWTHVDTVTETLLEMALTSLGTKHHLIQSMEVFSSKQLAEGIRDYVRKKYGQYGSLEFVMDREGNFSRDTITGDGNVRCWFEGRSLLRELDNVIDWYVANHSWAESCRAESRQLRTEVSTECGV